MRNNRDYNDQRSLCRRPLRVAAYIRVSADSLDQENSYVLQEQYFSELLTRNPEWVSAGVYSDYGISGTGRVNRVGYRRLLRHCREGKIDHIVCKSISRFSRNTGDFMTAMSLLKEHGVTAFFEKEGLDTSDPASEFILTTLAAIAQEESRTISSNIRWGIQKRYPRGQVRNYEIYSYRFAKGADAEEMLEGGYPIRRVEIVEEEAQVVRRIFRAVESGMRYADVARMLNLEQVRAPDHGRPKKKIRGRSTVREGLETGWTGAMIARIVTLERYCGDALLQKTYTPDYLTHKSVKNQGEAPRYMVRNHHPAVIDRELFERVQALALSRPGKGPSQGVRRAHAFSGRLVCAECGRNYNIRNAGCHPIWFCPTAALNNGKKVCHAGKVYEEQVIRMFRKALIDRFQLLADLVPDHVGVADIMSGRYGEDEAYLCRFDANAWDFVSRMCARLEQVQRMDFLERDRGRLKKRIAALDGEICALSGRGGLTEAETAWLEEMRTEIRYLEERLSHLERYWETVEYDYEEREKALAWMRTLPKGQEGTAAFLNGLTGGYVRAFALSITVRDPLHYRVRWYDDTETDVEMHSNIGDFRRKARI